MSKRLYENGRIFFTGPLRYLHSTTDRWLKSGFLPQLNLSGRGSSAPFLKMLPSPKLPKLNAFSGMKRLPRQSFASIGQSFTAQGRSVVQAVSNGIDLEERSSLFGFGRSSDRFRTGFVPVGSTWKRALDYIVAITALILLSPLLLTISAIILLTMGRPIFFAQNRLGANGTIFPCYKFRSMATNAEELLKHHLETDEAAAAEWKERRKLARDPRITPIGRLIRKTSIDEIPQLWNVLRGDMSCVGPRPIILDEIKSYGADMSEYFKARPGMTGAWQVSGRSSLDYAERIALDVNYINNWSIWSDCQILAMTIPALMKTEQTS